MPATFDAEDWAHLTWRERKALPVLAAACDEFEPLAKFAGVGQVGVEHLIAKGLVEEGPSCHPAAGKYGYRLTKKGRLAIEWLWGAQTRRAF